MKETRQKLIGKTAAVQSTPGLEDKNGRKGGSEADGELTGAFPTPARGVQGRQSMEIKTEDAMDWTKGLQSAKGLAIRSQ